MINKGGILIEYLKFFSADNEMNHDFFFELAPIIAKEVERMSIDSPGEIKWIKVQSPFKKLNDHLESFFFDQIANDRLYSLADNLPNHFVNASGFLFCILEQKMRGGIIINLEAFPEINVVVIK